MVVRGADVEVRLEPGRWHVRWPEIELTAGPFIATLDAAHERFATDDRPGAWTIARRPGPEGAGTIASWRSSDDQLALHLHVPDRGAFVRVEFRATAARPSRLIALRPLVGRLGLASSALRLVNGHQSWDYAGVRPAAVAGASWWTGAFAVECGAVVLQALGAARFTTEIRSRAADDAIEIEVRSAATPEIRPVAGSWGFTTHGAGEPWLDVAAGTRLEAEPIVVGAASDPLVALEDAAVLAGRALRAKHWRGEPMRGWESWYHYGSSITPETLVANGRILRERYQTREGFRLLQLDDGWQRAHGDWRPNERWPSELKAIAAMMRELGCLPGLWLAPFMIEPGTEAATAHAPRLVRDPSGERALLDPLVHRHALDGTDPAALEWLHELGRTVRRAGFGMVKLDFLYLGALEGRRHEASATGTEALRRGLGALVDGLGDGVYVLACGAPMFSVAGLCHGNRIGGDLAAPIVRTFPPPFDPANGAFGIRTQARNAAARFFLHRHLYDVDPDVVMAAGPDDGPPYSLADVRALATLAALAGGPFLLADALAELTPAKRAVLEDPELLDLTWGDGFRPLDLFARADEPAGGLEHFFAAPTAVPRRWQRSGRETILFLSEEEASDGDER